MADYYVAASLVALRTEINRRWPNRDKASDGAIGDPSHQARKSDHNPDWDAAGVVRAIDIDKDGIVVQELLDAVVRDPRVAYVIWNRRIASATDDGKPWDWEPYDGDNPHDKHIHVSIKHTRSAETNTSRWFKPTTPEDDMSTADVTAINAYTKVVCIQIQKHGDQVLATAISRLTDHIDAKFATLASDDEVDEARVESTLADLKSMVTDLANSQPEVDDPEANPKA